MNLIAHMNALELKPGQLGIYGLGQMGFVLRGPDATIYLDPYLTDSDGGGGTLERNFAPPLKPHEVTNADLVLCSHDHVDHFDRQTLEPLSDASPQARIAAPFPCDTSSFLAPERRIVAHAFEPFPWSSARITPIPSAHTELERGPEGYPFLGFVLEWNGLTVYHSGDTLMYAREGDTPGLLETLANWTLDVAIVPINGRDAERAAQGLVGNMNALEAFMLVDALGVGLTFPGHHDLFKFNAADPEEFRRAAQKNPARAYKFLAPGEFFLLERRT